MEAAIKRSKQRDLASGTPQVEDEDIAPSFPLLDIPDDQLDAEGLKQKRQQRLNKAGYEARMRTKAEKEAERRAWATVNNDDGGGKKAGGSA